MSAPDLLAKAEQPDMAALVAERGYVVTYRRTGTHCPGCGGSNWLIGRVTAECAQCGTALPLLEPVTPEHAIERID